MYTISDIAEQIRGVSFKPADIVDKSDDNAIGILRANNIADGVINLDDLIYIKRTKVKPNQILRNNDILICASSGSKHLVGKAAQFEFEGEYSFGAFCKVVRPKNINNTFLGMFFQSEQYRRYISNASQGANINNIRNEDIANIKIKKYSLIEQDNIARILSAVTKIIALHKQQLTKLDDLIKARFVEMFGDPVIDTMKWGQFPLSYYLKSIRYGTSTPPSFSDTGYEFIRATNIKNGKIVNSDMKYISEDEAQKIEKCKVIGNEMIIVRSGANTGDTCIITDEHCGQYAGYDIILEFSEKLHPIFINILINTDYMYKVVKPLTRRAAQPHLNAAQVQNLPIIKTPIALQNRFASFVAQVDKSKTIAKQCLQKAEYLKSALMQKYFG